MDGADEIQGSFLSSIFFGDCPEHFHIQTRLPDGRPSIIIDPGSVGNLCGDKWASEVARCGVRNGMTPKHDKRPNPLKVSGVGNGTQDCHYDCTLPVALRQADGSRSVRGHLTTPAVHSSDLPGLLGLTALRKNRAILDFSTLKLHFCGPGDIKTDEALPPGTESFQLEHAPSGHLVLPCCEFSVPQSTRDDSSLTLLQSSVPTPPAHPPVLPETARREIVLPAVPSADQSRL